MPHCVRRNTSRWKKLEMFLKLGRWFGIGSGVQDSAEEEIRRCNSKELLNGLDHDGRWLLYAV